MKNKLSFCISKNYIFICFRHVHLIFSFLFKILWVNFLYQGGLNGPLKVREMAPRKILRVFSVSGIFPLPIFQRLWGKDGSDLQYSRMILSRNSETLNEGVKKKSTGLIR